MAAKAACEFRSGFMARMHLAAEGIMIFNPSLFT
jgi:hypothetical protein